MIAHVAEAGEFRGRVVLQFASGRPSPVAIEAAIRIARAFQSEIESLFVEDTQLIELSGFPFAREISFSGRSTRTITSGDIERDIRFAFSEARRRVEAHARRAEVPLRQTIVRGEPVKALAAACAECGPWNLIALAEPFTSPACPPLGQLFELRPRHHRPDCGRPGRVSYRRTNPAGCRGRRQAYRHAARGRAARKHR